MVVAPCVVAPCAVMTASDLARLLFRFENRQESCALASVVESQLEVAIPHSR